VKCEYLYYIILTDTDIIGILDHLFLTTNFMHAVYHLQFTSMCLQIQCDVFFTETLYHEHSDSPHIAPVSMG